MRLSNVIRWLGLVAVIGGICKVLFTPLELVWGEDSTPALLIGGLTGTSLVILGLIGIYLYQAEKTGVLGFIGFFIISLGNIILWGILFISVFVNTVLMEPQLLEQDWPGPIDPILIVMMAAIYIGYIIFGIATLRAKVLPRWTGIVMLLFVLLNFVPLDFIGDYIEVVWGIFHIGLGWAVWSKSTTISENMV